MNYHLFSEKFPIAKKSHKCIWCGEQIKQGQKYVREHSVYDGGFQNHPWHLECRIDANDFWRENPGDEFLPYDNERPLLDINTINSYLVSRKAKPLSLNPPVM